MNRLSVGRILTICLFAILITMVACGGAPTPPPKTFFTIKVLPYEEPTSDSPTPTATPLPREEATPEPAPSAAVSFEVPDYVTLLELRDQTGKFVGRGGIFLADKAKGLFATNASNVGEALSEGLGFNIYIGGVWHPAWIEEQLVNWEANAALVRIKGMEKLSLPVSAPLGKTLPEGSKVRVVGYRHPLFEETALPNTSATPYAVEAVVDTVDSALDFSSHDIAERALLMDEFLMARPEGAETFQIPEHLRDRYYRHYVIVIQKPEEDPQKWFRPGVGGMPVLSESGDVVAMMSGLFDPVGLGYSPVGVAIPVEEIRKLLKKADGVYK